MTKRDLALRISRETGIIQEDVAAIIQKFLDHITAGLIAGQRAEFRDFGVFEVKVRKARVGRNPNQPQRTVKIPQRKVVRFKPGKQMRAKVLKS